MEKQFVAARRANEAFSFVCWVRARFHKSVRGSSSESSLVAGLDVQTEQPDLQEPELA